MMLMFMQDNFALEKLLPGIVRTGMISKLALFTLAPIFVQAMEPRLSDDISSISLLDVLPRELLAENILKQATPSSLLVISMTSKDLCSFATAELSHRHSEDFADLFGQDWCYLKGDGDNFCSSEMFIERVWPKSNLSVASEKLERTLKHLFESFHGISSPLQNRPFQHLRSFPNVTKTVLRLELPPSIKMDECLITEVPWMVISKYVNGDIGRIENVSHLSEVILSLLIDGEYDVVQSIIADESLGGKIGKYLPFSLEFLTSFLSTRSVEETITTLDPKEHLNGYCHSHDEFFMSAGLSVDALVDLFRNIRYSVNENDTMLVLQLLRFGYEPDLAWFENSKFFQQELMAQIKTCLEMKDCSQLEEDSLEIAIIYFLFKSNAEEVPVDKLQSNIKDIVNGREFEPSRTLIMISKYFCQSKFFEGDQDFCEFIPFRGITYFKIYSSDPDMIFSRNVRVQIDAEALRAASHIVENGIETMVPEAIERFFSFADKHGILEAALENSDRFGDYISRYLARKRLSELLSLISKIDNLVDGSILGFCSLRALLRKEGGIQALRESRPGSFPILLDNKCLEDIQTSLERNLDMRTPELFLLIDYLLFNGQPTFKVRVHENWSKIRRFRFDSALTKATSLYPVALLIKSLRAIGVDQDSLVSMYIVRALMSTPEGREAAQGFISNEDHESAIKICKSVAPYF